MKTEHIHKFELRKKPVLLSKYRYEDGEIKYVNTTARDTLKQFVCKCGKVETVDLERTAV